ncbi:MAG: hypothetical protein H7836_11445, partial [Magnetococcus sp. YQC-3]
IKITKWFQRVEQLPATIEAEEIEQTAKAIHVFYKDWTGVVRDLWLPRSQIQIDELEPVVTVV